MQKEELISALRARMVGKRNIVWLGTVLALSLYIFLISMQLICTELLLCLWEMPNNGHLRGMFILSGICINFGGIYLNNDVLEISINDFVDRDQDPLMTILLNQNMNHECTCKMQIKPRHYLVC